MVRARALCGSSLGNKPRVSEPISHVYNITGVLQSVRVQVLPAVTRRQDDLLALKAAIDAYYLETGAYPPAYDGLKGIHDRGTALL